MVNISRLARTTLYAQDVRRLAAFYASALGLQETSSEDGSAALSIEASSSRELILLNDPRHMHVAFSVSTLHEFHSIWQTLKALGVFTRGPYRQQEGPTFSFYDPEGNHVQVIWAVPYPEGGEVTFARLEEWEINKNQ